MRCTLAGLHGSLYPTDSDCGKEEVLHTRGFLPRAFFRDARRTRQSLADQRLGTPPTLLVARPLRSRHRRRFLTEMWHDSRTEHFHGAHDFLVRHTGETELGENAVNALLLYRG